VDPHDSTPLVPAAPRWLFRGDDRAWDALSAALAVDPAGPADWPIAPSGPSMQVGDGVLLWRSGRGGGVAATCTVVGDPEAGRDADGRVTVTVPLRVDRALTTPIPPTTLLDDELLRPLAFMDLMRLTEHRVSAAQEQALRRLFELPEHTAPSDGQGDGPVDGRTVAVEVPVGLVPIVQELLVALGATAQPAARTAAATVTPSAQLVAQADEAARVHRDEPFTIDDVAATWRTGIGTARSRVDRMLETGLLERTGTVRAASRPGARPTRGRPPVLYRLVTPGSRARSDGPGDD